MSDKELVVRMSPEDQEIAEAYIGYGEDINMVASTLGVSKTIVSETVRKPAVRRFIDSVFLDTGYRNRSRIADVLDTMIAAKLEEAEEAGYYGNESLLDLLKFAQQVRKDEEKAQLDKEKASASKVSVHKHTHEGGSNYGDLMKKILDE